MKDGIALIAILIILIGIMVAGLLVMGTYQPNDTTPTLDDVDSIIIFNEEAQQVKRIHDDDTNVTCWIVKSGGVSFNTAINCIPDKQL